MITRKHKIYKIGTIAYPDHFWDKKIVPFLNCIGETAGFKFSDEAINKIINDYGKNYQIKTISEFITIYCKYMGWNLLSLSRQAVASEKTYTLTFYKYD